MPPRKKDPVPERDEEAVDEPKHQDDRQQNAREKAPAERKSGGSTSRTKKSPADKAPAKKEPAKKEAAKKELAKKQAPKKSAPKKAPRTRVGKAWEESTVGRFMTERPHRVDAGASLNDVARLMWEKDIGVVPVVGAEGRPEGIVTDRDIAMAAYLKGRRLQEVGVHEVMSTSVRSARADEPVTEACGTMARHQVRRLPVVDDRGRLVGMLSLKDLAERAGDAKSGGIAEAEIAAILRAISARRTSAEEQ